MRPSSRSGRDKPTGSGWRAAATLRMAFGGGAGLKHDGPQSSTCWDIGPGGPNKLILKRRHPGFNGCSLMTYAVMNS